MNFQYWMEVIASLTPNPSSQGYNERRQQLETSAFITNKGADPRLQTHYEVLTYDSKTRTEGWGTSRYVSRSQEAPSGSPPPLVQTTPWPRCPCCQDTPRPGVQQPGGL